MLAALPLPWLAGGRQELRSGPCLGCVALERSPAWLPPSSLPWAPHPGPSRPHSIGQAQAAATAPQAAPGDTGLQRGAGHPQVPVQRPVGGRVPEADGQPPHQSPGVLCAPGAQLPDSRRTPKPRGGRRRAPRVGGCSGPATAGRGGVGGSPKLDGKSQVPRLATRPLSGPLPNPLRGARRPQWAGRGGMVTAISRMSTSFPRWGPRVSSRLSHGRQHLSLA